MNRNAFALLVGCVLALNACGKQELRVPGGAAGGSNSASGGADSAGAAPEAGDAGQANGTPNPFERPRDLGAACTSNGDCGTQGLSCLGAEHDLSLELGAVPGGLCTHTCTADAQCQAYGSGAICANLAESPLALDLGAATTAPRYCMAGCALGPPGGASKCHGRDAAACRPFAPPHAQRCAATAPTCPDGLSCFRGYCREFGCGPRCNGDQDCASGRHCEPRSGLCTVSAAPETPVGTFCDPDAPSTTPCESGNCLVLFDENNVKTSSFCTQSCVIGTPCANGQGACQLPRFGDNYEVGDIGYCQPKCNCNADCKVPGDQCFAWGDAETEQLYSSKGACAHATGGVSLGACGGIDAPN
jgi:hypothetical protein